MRRRFKLQNTMKETCNEYAEIAKDIQFATDETDNCSHNIKTMKEPGVDPTASLQNTVKSRTQPSNVKLRAIHAASVHPLRGGMRWLAHFLRNNVSEHTPPCKTHRRLLT